MGEYVTTFEILRFVANIVSYYQEALSWGCIFLEATEIARK